MKKPPKEIKINIYYAEPDKGAYLIDEDEIRSEFEIKLTEIIENK